MMTENAIPEINGKDLKITEIDGPKGRFGVAFVGSDKDGDHRYFYQDERDQFSFYVDFESKPIVRCVVTRATKGSGPFRTSNDNESCFRQNIEFFFKTRHWLSPWRPGDDSSAVTPVSFSWRIVQ